MTPWLFVIVNPNSNLPQIVHSQTLPNLCSALAGAARTTLANPQPFIALDAAVAFWFFSATGKELGPRGYERENHHRWLVGNTNHREL
jgi:hypothetical protein